MCFFCTENAANELYLKMEINAPINIIIIIIVIIIIVIIIT